MSKIELQDTNSGYNLQKINNNFDKIETELNEKVLYRDNPDGEPNEMLNDLDMNGNRIYNLPVPVQEHEAARLKDVQDAVVGNINANVIRFEPTADIQSTNVQAAIEEVDGKIFQIYSDLSDQVNPELGAALIGYRGNTLYSYLESTSTFVENIDELRTVSGRFNGDIIYLKGHTWPGIGGGFFQWDNLTPSLVDDNALTIVLSDGSWRRIIENYVTPEMFGAKGDGVRDDTSELQASMRASGNGIHHIARGHYYITQEVTALPSFCLWDWYGARITGPTIPTPTGGLVTIVDRSDYTRVSDGVTWLGGRYTTNNLLDNCCGIVNGRNFTVKDQFYDIRVGQRGFAIQPGPSGATYENITVDNLTGLGATGVSKNIFDIDLGGMATINRISISGIKGQNFTNNEGAVRISSGSTEKLIYNLHLENVIVSNCHTAVSLRGVQTGSYRQILGTGVLFRGVDISYSDHIDGDCDIISANTTLASSGGVVCSVACTNMKLRGTVTGSGTGFSWGVYCPQNSDINFDIRGAFSDFAIYTNELAGNRISARFIAITGALVNLYRALDIYDFEYSIGGVRVRSLPQANNAAVTARLPGPPTSGAWVDGSIVWNTDPNSAGTPGWVCTVSGSPGQWKAMANLAA